MAQREIERPGCQQRVQLRARGKNGRAHVGQQRRRDDDFGVQAGFLVLQFGHRTARHGHADRGALALERCLHLLRTIREGHTEQGQRFKRDRHGQFEASHQLV